MKEEPIIVHFNGDKKAFDNPEFTKAFINMIMLAIKQVKSGKS